MYKAREQIQRSMANRRLLAIIVILTFYGRVTLLRIIRVIQGDIPNNYFYIYLEFKSEISEGE